MSRTNSRTLYCRLTRDWLKRRDRALDRAAGAGVGLFLRDRASHAPNKPTYIQAYKASRRRSPCALPLELSPLRVVSEKETACKVISCNPIGPAQLLRGLARASSVADSIGILLHHGHLGAHGGLDARGDLVSLGGLGVASAAGTDRALHDPVDQRREDGRKERAHPVDPEGLARVRIPKLVLVDDRAEHTRRVDAAARKRPERQVRDHDREADGDGRE